MGDVMFVKYCTNVVEELVYHIILNEFRAGYNFEHLSVATSGASR